MSEKPPKKSQSETKMVEWGMERVLWRGKGETLIEVHEDSNGKRSVKLEGHDELVPEEDIEYLGAVAVSEDSQGDVEHPVVGPAERGDPYAASVPFMVTNEMKRQLRNLGVTPATYRGMTPEQAWEKINAAKATEANSEEEKSYLGIGTRLSRRGVGGYKIVGMSLRKGREKYLIQKRNPDGSLHSGTSEYVDQLPDLIEEGVKWSLEIEPSDEDKAKDDEKSGKELFKPGQQVKVVINGEEKTGTVVQTEERDVKDGGKRKVVVVRVDGSDRSIPFWRVDKWNPKGGVDPHESAEDNSEEVAKTGQVDNYNHLKGGWLDPRRIQDLRGKFHELVDREEKPPRGIDAKTAEHYKKIVETRALETLLSDEIKRITRTAQDLAARYPDMKNLKIPELPSEEVKGQLLAMLDFDDSQLEKMSSSIDRKFAVGQEVVHKTGGKIQRGWYVEKFQDLPTGETKVFIKNAKGDEHAVLQDKLLEEQPDVSLVVEDRENRAPIDERTALELLSYADVISGEELEKAVAANASKEGYKQTLIDLMQEHGKKEVMSQAAELRKKCLDTLKELGIEPTKYGESISWALWDITKQSYLAKHPEESDGSKYKLGYPLAQDQNGAELLQEIIDRHVGWEIMSKHDGEENAPINLSTEATNEILKILNESERNESGQLHSYDLAKVGRVVRELLAQAIPPENESQQFFPPEIFPGMEVSVDVGNGEFVKGWHAKKCYKKDDLIYIRVEETKTGNKRDILADDLVEWQAKETPEFFPPEFSYGKEVKIKIGDQVYEGAIARKCFKKNDKIYIRIEDPAGKIFDISYETLGDWQALSVNSRYEGVKFYEPLPENLKQGTEIVTFYPDGRAANDEMWHTKASFKKGGNLYIEITGPGNQKDAVPYKVLSDWQKRAAKLSRKQREEERRTEGKNSDADNKDRLTPADIAEVVAGIFVPKRVMDKAAEAKEKAKEGGSKLEQKHKKFMIWLKAEDVPEEKRKKEKAKRHAKLAGRVMLVTTVAPFIL